MQVFNQSKTVSQAPYVHLGYLAASYLKPNKILSSAGIILLVFAVFFLAKSIIVSGKTRLGFTKLTINIKENKKYLLIAFIILMLVLACIYFSRIMGNKTYARPEYITYTNMINLDLKFKQKNIQQLPLSEKTKTEINKEQDYFHDGWFNELKLSDGIVNGRQQIIIISAGPDKTFGTEDDISSIDKKFIESDWYQHYKSLYEQVENSPN